MINKIVMKNVASYKAETVLETDKKVNLIYGLNGTGKSTLSSYLYDMTGEPYRECRVEGLGNTDKVLVYNQKFIADNFYETEEIQGIFTLSKKNKEVKKIVDEAKIKLKTLIENQSMIEKERDDPNDVVYLYRLAKETPLLYAELAMKENGLQDYVDAMNEFN